MSTNPINIKSDTHLYLEIGSHPPKIEHITILCPCQPYNILSCTSDFMDVRHTTTYKRFSHKNPEVLEWKEIFLSYAPLQLGSITKGYNFTLLHVYHSTIFMSFDSSSFTNRPWIFTSLSLASLKTITLSIVSYVTISL